MYKRVLLAYDGSVEGRTALREGALLAKRCDAQVYLLSVVNEVTGLMLAEGYYPEVSAKAEDGFIAVLNEGVDRLKQLGFDPIAKLVRGEPAAEIGNFARQIDADLVVVGHRRKSAFTRWWSGPSGAYLIDHIHCSLLVARNEISDEAIKTVLSTSAETTT